MIYIKVAILRRNLRRRTRTMSLRGAPAWPGQKIRSMLGADVSLPCTLRRATRQSVILPSRSPHPNAISTGRGGVPPPPYRIQSAADFVFPSPHPAPPGAPPPRSAGEGALRKRRSGVTISKTAGLKPRPTGLSASFDVSAPKRCHCEEYRRYDAAIRNPAFEVVSPERHFNR